MMPSKQENSLLAYQLEVLKQEIDLVSATIRQGDEITKSVKHWAITVWAAALGGADRPPLTGPC